MENKKPLLIIKKNNKKEIIIFEYSLYRYFCDFFGSINEEKYITGYINDTHIMMMLLTDFLEYIDPATLKDIIISRSIGKR